ncbi:hypothetical protein AWZ03_009327 [Drosophila navojoa]|uniref:Uncharacterized protein n=1 Tax=Drosophila navojoa TaxID=7232 RepID=A0A484B7H4_DRONA|nr:hypothetical protein AWZ03_009327 [Drosophila navojoa]
MAVKIYGQFCTFLMCENRSAAEQAAAAAGVGGRQRDFAVRQPHENNQLQQTEPDTARDRPECAIAIESLHETLDAINAGQPRAGQGTTSQRSVAKAMFANANALRHAYDQPARPPLLHANAACGALDANNIVATSQRDQRSFI